MIILPGGGYAEHAPHEAEPIADWLGQIGVPASVFRYPLHARHPVPLEALRAEISRRRIEKAKALDGVDTLVSACPWSERPLTEQGEAQGMEVFDIFELVAEAAGFEV